MVRTMPDIASQVGLPASLESERLVLGALILGADYTLVELGADDFSLEKHRRIYRCIGDLYERGDRIDYATLANELHRHQELESVDGVTYLITLEESAIPSAIDAHVRIIREKSILRRAIGHAQQFINRCVLQESESGELLSEAEAFIRDLAAQRGRKDEFRTYKQILSDEGGIQALSREDWGIQTPWPRLNAKVIGLLPGDLAIVGGRPSSGKSAMAQQLGDYVAARYGTVASFQLEQAAKRILLRGIAKTSCEIEDGSAVSVNEIRRSSRLSPLQRHGVLAAANKITELPVQINTTARTAQAIHAALRKLCARTEVQAVIVDHLHEMRSVGRAEKRLDELRRMTGDMKFMAVDLKVPVVLLAQLNRASDNEDRPPMISDLRECGDIEAIADIVILLHNKEKFGSGEDKPPFADVDVILAKQRDGPRRDVIPFMFWGTNLRFQEAS